MAVVTAGAVTQSAPGSVLTFTDTTTGLTAPIVRSLVVYDPNGTPIATPVFSGLSATLDITADGWFSFVETIIDANGAYVLTINYLSTAFYQNAFANAIAAQPSVETDYFAVFFNLNRSQDYYFASVRFFIGGFGIASQAAIQQANFYVNTPYYAS